MSIELTEEQKKDLHHKKAAHDYFATAIQMLITKPFYYDDFEGAHATIGFLKNMLAQIKTDIETLEPSKKEEPKPAYEMDLTHLTSGAQSVQAN